jgi:hypothetical protein
MSLKLPTNFVNRAKPRPPRDPYSALRHRYNYPLMYTGIYQPELIGPIYIDKYNMEYADAENFIKTNMSDFVEQTELGSRDIIMELIGINRFKRDLLTNTFFVIDYDFLMMKFRLTRDCSPSKALKINALINNVLLPSYKAIWCIKDTLKIARDLFLKTSLGTSKQEPVTSLLDIIIDEDLMEEVEIDDELLTFNELWENDESAFRIPETISITPLMVIEYYVRKLNKLVVKLHHYKIDINETIIQSINQGLMSLNNTLKVIYNYNPQWLIVVENTKKTQSLTQKKTKSSSSKRSSKRLIKSL